jgi:hypothetical protein
MSARERDYKPADYISLPSTFFNIPAVIITSVKHGLKGELFCIKLCSYLASKDNFRIDIGEQGIADMSKEIRMTIDDVKVMIKFLVEEVAFLQRYKEGDLHYIECEYLNDVMLGKLLKARDRKYKHAKKVRAR